jgi:hypothetical protein
VERSRTLCARACSRRACKAHRHEYLSLSRLSIRQAIRSAKREGHVCGLQRALLRLADDKSESRRLVLGVRAGSPLCLGVLGFNRKPHVFGDGCSDSVRGLLRHSIADVRITTGDALSLVTEQLRKNFVGVTQRIVRVAWERCDPMGPQTLV